MYKFITGHFVQECLSRNAYIDQKCARLLYALSLMRRKTNDIACLELSRVKIIANTLRTSNLFAVASVLTLAKLVSWIT